MPAIARLGDGLSGHDCYPPHSLNSASDNVFVNGVGVCKFGDISTEHACPDTLPHSGNISSGSTSVFVNGQPAGRIGDPISCGSVIISGSGNVFVG